MASPSQVLEADKVFKRLQDFYISYSGAKNPMQLAKVKAQVRSTAFDTQNIIDWQFLEI